MGFDASKFLQGNFDSSIADFLKRPVIVTSGTSFPAPLTPTSTFALPTAYFNQPSNPGLDKVSGFLGMRATTVITLVANATKFTQGRIILGWLPNNSARGDEVIRLRSRTSITQLPHVEMDLSCDTTVVMRIPYYSVSPYYGLIADSSGTGANIGADFGSFFLYTYGPVATGTSAGTPVAEYTVYVHFEDLELIGPAFTAQSGNRTYRMKPEDLERDKPVSTALGLASKAAMVAGNLPLISSFMKSASWALAASSNLASRFGYAKPIVDAPMTRVARYELAYMNTKDGAEAALPMGNSVVNSIKHCPEVTGNDVDEMSLKFIAQIPCWISTGTMAVTDPPGTEIAGWTIGTTAISAAPRTPFKSTGTTFNTTLTTYDYTPLGLLLDQFQYFHGSIKLRIKVVKTQYHSGRIEVTFNPGVVSTNAAKKAYLLREIIDLQSGNEFELTFPHITFSPWLRLGSTIQAVKGDTFGDIRVRVVNALLAPSTCASSISLIYEMFAGDDCEFACPINQRFGPCYPNIATTANIDPTTFSAQSSDSNPCASIPSPGSFGGLAPLKPTSDITECITGEEFTSIKQICSMSSRYGQLNNAAQYGVLHRVGDLIPVSAADTQNAALTPLNTWMACYGYINGSYKYYYQFSNAGNNTVPIVSTTHFSQCPYTLPSVNYPTVPATNLNFLAWSNQQALSFSSTSVVSIHVPAYNQLAVRIIRPNQAVYDSTTSPMIVTVNTQGAYTGVVNIWRALGDDARFSYWLGTPPISTLRNG